MKLAKNIIKSTYSIYINLPSANKYSSDKNLYATPFECNNIYDEPPPLSRSRLITSTSSSSNNNTNSATKLKLKKILYSPLHHGSNLSTINRPNSRNSLNSRLSSSHNSLSVAASNKVDDSIFITQAMSHDALLGREIIDFYNVPIDSDIYALPVDFVKTQPYYKKTAPHRTKTKYSKNYLNCNNKKRRRNNYNNDSSCTSNNNNNNNNCKIKITKSNDKRHSVPENSIEPMHMTLDEVKQYYHSLYSSSSDSSENLHRKIIHFKKSQQFKSNQQHHQQSYNNNNSIRTLNNSSSLCNTSSTTITNANGKLTKTKVQNNTTKKLKNGHELMTIRHQTSITNTTSATTTAPTSPPIIPNKKSSQFSINLNFKQKFCSIFRFRKTSVATTVTPTSTTISSASTVTLSASSQINTTPNSNSTSTPSTRSSHQSFNYLNNSTINNNNNNNNIDYAISSEEHHNKVIMTSNKKIKFSTRALPPLPGGKGVGTTGAVGLVEKEDAMMMEEKLESSSCSTEQMDFATNLEKVKECGWYWGPISSEAAEKILSNEPDGSFIVRDSSDDHYIFSLTFKLSGCIRHVRIEQYQG